MLSQRNKFAILLCFLIIYYLYMSHKLGFHQGFHVIVLTWCFLVLCTPVSDAGFILSFPVRLFFDIPMIITQVFVFFLSISIVALYKNRSQLRETYKKTLVLQLLDKVVTHLNPWIWYIIVCQIGTFVSVLFYDHIYSLVSGNASQAANTTVLSIAGMILIISWIVWGWMTAKLHHVTTQYKRETEVSV